jgi:beta-mannosidase
VNGWNWVPADALYGVPRPDRVEHLLHLAAGANVNLLRVWGGGLIETEAFYGPCDRLGIMVWQEFSQSSSGIESTPSADPAYVELMRHEAEAIVPLRRNHPSLAVWCGGNELENAGGGPLDEEQSPVLAALRDVVRRLDPERAWLPTSPTGPRFHNRLDVIAADPDGLHDVHGPWEHQGLAAHHELYDRGTSLFNSEFGVEGMANRRTHEALIRPEHRWPAGRDNAVYRHLGDWWNNEPLVQESFGGRLRDLDSLRRASQFLQAEGLRYAIEANRRRWPRNSGSIPWQLNESYPNAWCTSVVDHRGDPKPAYFAVKRAFAPTVVCAAFPSPALTGSHVLAFDVWAWSWAGVMTARWRVVGIDGSFDSETGEELDLVDGRPARVGLSQVLELPRPEALFFLDLRLDAASGTTLATNRYLLSGGSDFGPILDLAAATLDVDVAADGDAWRLEVCHRSGPAAIGVRLEDDRPITEPGWAEIDDGAFDLLPGEQRTVTVRWADAPARDRRLRLDAWNVAPIEVAA